MKRVILENHPDAHDRASELELATTADAIYRTQKLAVQKQLPGPDGLYPSPDCLECGNEIPLGRLKVAANNILCVFCATAAERMRR